MIQYLLQLLRLQSAEFHYDVKSAATSVCLFFSELGMCQTKVQYIGNSPKMNDVLIWPVNVILL